MTLSLVILAAGMGSRFGGPKQLAPLGPSGETMMDYAAYDARRAGFDELVVVTRAELEGEVRTSLERGAARAMPVRYALQRHDDLPEGVASAPGRTKPWGTGHAVLAAEPAVRGPFAVVNADDFYGARSYAVAADFLRNCAASEPSTRPTYGVVGFALGETLSERGSVNRARLDTDADGWLEHVEELRGIVAADRGARTGDGTRLSLEQPVSMNMWAFTPSIFPAVRQAFREFLRAHRDEPSAELLIPSVAEALIAAGRARVRVLPGGGPWCGVTHPEDVPAVRAEIAALVARRAYPSPLWS